MKFKVGDEVEKPRSKSRGCDLQESLERNKGCKWYVDQIQGEDGVTVNGDYYLAKDLKLIKKSMKLNKNKHKKADWKVGDVVYNEYNSQKSKVLAVAWDSEDEMFKYTLQCLDDSGSIHLIYEESISEIEVKEMTVAELKSYYEENETCDVKIVK